jgi:pseudomonalisin
MSTRRVLTLGLSGLLVAGASLAASANATSTPSAWVPTATAAFPAVSTLLHTAPASQQMNVSVALKLQHRSALIQRIEAIAAGKQTTMTPAAARAAYSPSPAAVTAVRDYLQHSGFRGVQVSADRLLVSGTASVATVQNAFHTTIADLRVGGRTIFANTSTAMVPRALGSSVASVLGLSDWQLTQPALHVTHLSKAKAKSFDGITPVAMANVYGANHLRGSRTTNIAIFMAGDPAPIIKNLRFAEKQYHVAKAPVTVVYGENKLADTESNPETGSEEWDLDTQMSTVIAGGVKRIYLYDGGTFADPDVTRAIDQFVSAHKARNMSLSVGECDVIAFSDGAMTAMDDEIALGGAQGQSVFASTGDNGPTCPEVASTGLPTGLPGISWPADGEFTTAVGGTELSATPTGTVKSESAWDGGGGGISEFETAAPWTLRANVAGQTWQENNFGGRSIPDISAAADASPPILIFAGSKTPEGVSGTSVSAPLVMGLWTRIESADHRDLGMATPLLYRLYNQVNPGTYTNQEGIGVYAPALLPKSVAGLKDITSGTNFGYPAKAGYDYATGLGVFKSATLARRLK